MDGTAGGTELTFAAGVFVVVLGCAVDFGFGFCFVVVLAEGAIVGWVPVCFVAEVRLALVGVTFVVEVLTVCVVLGAVVRAGAEPLRCLERDVVVPVRCGVGFFVSAMLPLAFAETMRNSSR